jgi:SIR2-like domain
MQGTPEHSVFVMGAGASLAEAQARRPTRTKEHPPLDANFFQRVAKHRSSTLFRAVQRVAARLGVDDLARANPSVGLEEYLGRLFFNANHNPLSTSVREYYEAIDLYAWEVLATTNWMIGKAGMIKRVLQREVAAGRRVSVITFNIDLLIENALERLAHSRPSAPWGLMDAYGFATPPDTLYGAAAHFDESGPAEIKLYKMHGSVNWVFPIRDLYPPGDLASRPREIKIVVDKELPPHRLRVGTGKTRGRTTWYGFPLIVPPIYEKHAFIRMHLQEVWESAQAALQDASKVVFWGYSFPVADTHARQFFQGMADRNPVLRSPIVINPDPATGAALWTLLRADQVTQYRDVGGYLSA